MKLSIIDFKKVQADIDSGVPTNFNTNFHTEAEAPGLTIPITWPYSFERWLPLILKSRKIPSTALQTISLTRPQVRLIVDAAGASIHTRLLSRVFAEDLQEEVYPAFKKLLFPSEGLFMRLGACSPKDGVQEVPGQMAIHTVEDIVLRLTTSQRAAGTFGNMLNGEAEEIQVYFLPFDSRMRAETEYRVFCPPGPLQMVAVSQYRWHKPWMHSENKTVEEMKETAENILEHIKAIHAQILGNLSDETANQTGNLIRNQGFVFDVLFDEPTGQCELIELNSFGSRSGCGSCLFQWLKDRDLLYGKESEVEFRVAA